MIEHTEKIVCEMCKKTFRSIGGLQFHNRTYHKGKETHRRRLNAEKNFKCIYCRMRYFTKKGLDLHIAEHGKYFV